MTAPSTRLTRALAVFASTAFALALVCAWGWHRAARERISIEALSPEQRQELVQELILASPGAFMPALFEPAIGYTLRPNQRITAWNDTFESNEIGYRTGRLPGRKGGERAFRVVFIGDSWTFGEGVREAESFPARFGELANRLGAAGGVPVQVINLGLPGYNTFNEIAALDFFYDRLRPDAVVISPTGNDADSTASVLPNGGLTRLGVVRDAMGSDHGLAYPGPIDSFEERRRWRRSFDEIRGLEERLRSRGVPLMVFFAATWDERFADSLIQGSGITAPYMVTPRGLTSPRWRNPPPFFHGTPEANELFGHMVYQGMATLLGWPPAPPPDEKAAVGVPLHRRPPAGAESAVTELLTSNTARVPDRYVPGKGARIQCVGPIDCDTGLIGRATTLFVRRRAGATRLAVSLRRLPNAPSILPLPVRVSIPSPSGGTEARAMLTAGGADPLVVQVPIPADVPVGAALDVQIRAGRAVSAPVLVAPRSLFIAGIEQNEGEP